MTPVTSGVFELSGERVRQFLDYAISSRSLRAEAGQVG